MSLSLRLLQLLLDYLLLIQLRSLFNTLSFAYYLLMEAARRRSLEADRRRSLEDSRERMLELIEEVADLDTDEQRLLRELENHPSSDEDS